MLEFKLIQKTIFLFFVITNGYLNFLSGNTIIENSNNELKKLYLDFDYSVQYGYTQQELINLVNKKRQLNYMPILKEIYEKNNFLKKINESQNLTNNQKNKIPKIIHQIWLGSPFPDCYKNFQESWIRNHPTWEYKLWTDKDVSSFNLINKTAFYNAKNYAEKSDIWRYEIIERYGGLYVDTDFECFKSFDILHELYEFYAGVTPITQRSTICNALIAAIPNHPILKKCIAEVTASQHKTELVERTGPILFSRIIIESYLHDSNFDLKKIIILPPGYLYPFPPKKIILKNFILPETFAAHHWEQQWHGLKNNKKK